jgi:hypothetical protein
LRQKIITYRHIRPSDKERAFFNQWSYQRDQPKWQFILLHGILKEAFLIFVFIKLIQYINHPYSFSVFYNTFTGLLFLLFEITFWMLGGFVVGWLKYNSREIEYQLIKELMD